MVFAFEPASCVRGAKKQVEQVVERRPPGGIYFLGSVSRSARASLLHQRLFRFPQLTPREYLGEYKVLRDTLHSWPAEDAGVERRVLDRQRTAAGKGPPKTKRSSSFGQGDAGTDIPEGSTDTQ
jgi:hypothetical protein